MKVLNNWGKIIGEEYNWEKMFPKYFSPIVLHSINGQEPSETVLLTGRCLSSCLQGTRVPAALKL